MTSSVHAERLNASSTDEGRYRLLAESVTDCAIFMLDTAGCVSSWNAGARRFKGYEAAEIIGQHFSRFYGEEDREAGLPAKALETASHAGRFEGEGWRMRKDGSRFWANVVIDPIRAEDGALVGFAKITRDLTERKLAADILAQSEQQFSLLVQSVTDYAIYMLDPHGIVTTWNAGAERIKGYKSAEIIGKYFSCFYTDEDRAAGEHVAALEIALRYGRFEKEGWRVRKDGTRFWANVVIDPIRTLDGTFFGFAKITRDVTERQEAQKAAEISREVLFHSRKLDSIGQLTGGIAHDFNNILGELTLLLNLIQKRVDAGRSEEIAPLLKAALDSTQRAGTLTHRLLAFARRQPLDVKAADINALATGMEDLLRRTIGENIALEVALKDGTWPVLTDSDQLDNALLNLVINARDAMPAGGRLTIETANTHLDEIYARQHIDVQAGDYVVISVSDTGSGMSEATISQAFDPFFTTKPLGQGTGLGLSMVHGFAKQSGGHARIYSEIDRGTTVKLYLRRAITEVEQPDAALSAEVSSEQGEIILLVDDNPILLLAMQESITELGYNCLAVSDAQAAITILNSAQRVDLLVTDVGLPIMNGRQLAEIAQQLRRELKVLFITGYTAKAAVRGSFLDAGMEMLSKPFTLDALGAKVRQLIAP